MAPEPADPSEELVFRRGKLRKRDDYAVDLFREALALLAEPPGAADRDRLPRILIELGRFYNPVANGPVLDPPGRREVLELVEAGRREDAHRVLEACLRAYSRQDRPVGEDAPPAPGNRP